MIIFSGNKYMRFLKTISYNDSMDCLHGRVTLSLPLYVMVICSTRSRQEADEFSSQDIHLQ